MKCKVTNLDCADNKNGWCGYYKKQLKDVTLSEKIYCLEYSQPSMEGFAERPETKEGCINYDELPEELEVKSKEDKSIYQRALDFHGIMKQVDMLIEEMAELTQALSKFKRNKSHNVEKEIADVFITLKQVKLAFDQKVIKKWLDFKINKLEIALEREGVNENNTSD